MRTNADSDQHPRSPAFLFKESWPRVLLIRMLAILPLAALSGWTALKFRAARLWLVGLWAVLIWVGAASAVLMTFGVLTRLTTATTFAVVAGNLLLSQTHFRHNRTFLAIVLGGLALGLMETFTRSYLPDVSEGLDRFSTGVVFIIVAVFFVVRPSGLFKVESAERV